MVSDPFTPVVGIFFVLMGIIELSTSMRQPAPGRVTMAIGEITVGMLLFISSLVPIGYGWAPAWWLGVALSVIAWISGAYRYLPLVHSASIVGREPDRQSHPSPTRTLLLTGLLLLAVAAAAAVVSRKPDIGLGGQIGAVFLSLGCFGWLVERKAKQLARRQRVADHDTENLDQ